jgi:hypothetical protein
MLQVKNSSCAFHIWLAAEGTVAFCGSLAIVVGWGFSVWDFFVAQ